MLKDIAAVGLYYYQIDDGIEGGELELSSVIKVEQLEHHSADRQFTEMKRLKVELSEGTSLVFSNDYCYHRVCKLHGNGSRKMIAFFLLRGSAVHPFDARDVAVNLKHHATHFVEQSLRAIDDENMWRGNAWLIRLVQQYVVGDRAHIAKALDIYRDCRQAQSYEIRTHRRDLERRNRYRLNPYD